MINAFSLSLSRKAKERLAWMDRYRICGNAALVCRKFAIAECTFWRWKKRYNPWDLLTLEEKSRKPAHSPHATPWPVVQRILTLKHEHPRWGKEKAALFLKSEGMVISGKTVWKIWTRHSMVIRYRTRKRKAPKPRVDWTRVRLPGDLVQLDTKHISLHGRKLYQYTFIDVVSRWRYAKIHHAADMATTILFLNEALQTCGLKVSVIQTDNGSEFGKQVTNHLHIRKIQHVFSHKCRPQENAYVERSHRIDEEEFYSLGNLGVTVDDLRERFAAYMNMYNTVRPHWSLDGKTPTQVLTHYLHTKPYQMS